MSTDTLPTTDELAAEALVDQRERLLARLSTQRELASDAWRWYAGTQELPTVPANYTAAYRLLLALSPTPWARLVVDTIAERLHVQGFTAGSPEAGARVWEVFTDSQLNADERLVYTEALIAGVGYVSVGEGGRIAPESAFEVTHEPELGNRRNVAAALKLYPADYTFRVWVCELYRPEATYRWVAELAGAPRPVGAFPIDGSRRKSELGWEPLGDPTANGLGDVPVVAFENRAAILGGGVSEIADCVPILKRIDKLTLDKLLTSEFAAFRQKWATGLEVPRDPETQKPVEPYSAAVTKLWVSEQDGTRFGTFEASDLGPYLAAIDAEIATLAAISRVPSHYLLQRNLANPPSAESLIAGESGLVAKVQERQARFGEAWERTLEMALELAGDGPPEALEVVWADAEMRNPAQVADAATKLQTVGWPPQAVWAYTGATPQQIREWTLLADSAALDAAGGPPPPPPRPAP
jgi:Phage portal protein, SPP1 Gp6-like